MAAPDASAVPDVVALAQTLIACPTPNPPGEERPLAELLVRILRRHGVEAETLPAGSDGEAQLGGAAAAAGERAPPQANVLARVRGRGRRPPLVFCGHLDTVPPGEGTWKRDPYGPVVEAGRLYGLGAADMKGALAAMVVAAARLADEAARGRALEGDVLLAFTSREETTSQGARAFARSGLLDGAAGLVIGEPTGNRVGIAEKGGLWLEIVTTGRTAHGSLPHLGANAVAGLAEILVELERAAAPAAAHLGASATAEAARLPQDTSAAAVGRALAAPPHPLLGAPSLVATRIGGGVANNVVPDRASATLDVRTLPGQDAAAIQQAIAALAGAVAARRGLAVEVRDLGVRPALGTSPDHPLVVACASAVEAVLGTPAAYCGLTGATDATELVPPLGLPFVILGPGEMAQAHQPDEWVSIAALRATVEMYLHLARTILA